MDGSVIAKNINALLSARGIKKAEFYRACALTSAAFSQWNTGATVPRMDTLQRIAAYLKVPVSVLLGDEKPAVPKHDGERYPILPEISEKLSALSPSEQARFLLILELLEKD